MNYFNKDHPTILDPKKSVDFKKFTNLYNNKNVKCTDTIKDQLFELYSLLVLEDESFKDTFGKFDKFINYINNNETLNRYGKWVFFPWNSTLVHLLNIEEFCKVRTSRNKHLISNDDQERFWNSTIGIAGLSVGSHAIASILLSGGGRSIRLADYDLLDLSNLNRIRTTIDKLGYSKLKIIMQELYGINPYIDIDSYNEGLNSKNIASFFIKNKNKLNLIIDEVDEINVKLLIRKYAKKFKVPVIMAADVGDNSVVFVERYDVDFDTTPFCGSVKTLEKKMDKNMKLKKKLTKNELGEIFREMIGDENHSKEMIYSLSEIGKSLVTWPQLGTTAILSGLLVAYYSRLILTGKSVKSGKFVVSVN